MENDKGLDLINIAQLLLSNLTEAKFSLGDHQLTIKKTGVDQENIICAGCSQSIPESSNFCPVCGAKRVPG